MKPSSPLIICLLGATGKMGQAIFHLASKDPDFQLIKPPSRDHFEIPLKESTVAIDFSSPAATLTHLHTAHLLKKPLVLGTTGLDPQTFEALQQASLTIPILYSPNFSLGMALCLNAIQTMSRHLFGNCSIHITETHHIHKKDAPSGTALAMARIIGQGTIVPNSPPSPHSKNQITIESFRLGDTIGEHCITFQCEHERIQLIHQAHSREAFAEGALKAAQFLVHQPPGLYSISDLLNIGTVQ